MSVHTWDEVKVQHPVGSEIRGVIANIQIYGVWVKYDFEFFGLMLIPDSGIERGRMLTDVFSVGQSITAMVIHHNDQKNQLVLSRRA